MRTTWLTRLILTATTVGSMAGLALVAAPAATPTDCGPVGCQTGQAMMPLDCGPTGCETGKS